MRKIINIGFLAGVVAIWLCGASSATAGTAGDDQVSSLDGIDDVPPADIAGWFLTFDASNQWTTEANIVTMESWLAVAEEMAAGNPGVNDPQAGAVYQVLTSNSLAQQDAAPEPATLGLLGGALACLGLYAVRLNSEKSLRRITADSTYVSLRRTD